MRAKTIIRLSLESILLFTVAIPSLSAQQPVPSRDAVSRTAPAKQKQGLVEFALQGINPSDRNYGTCLDEARKLLIQETVDRAYFWSNLAALAVAVCLLVVVVHQQGLLRRREFMAAECVTQLRNALARAESQIEEATRRNHALMQALSALSLPSPGNTTLMVDSAERGKQRKPAVPTTASTLTATTPPAPATSGANRKAPVPSPAPVPAVVPAPPSAPSTPAAAQESRSGSQLGLFGSDGDFVAKINTLQQQLSTSQERERHLRRQLNDSELRFQKEREKSRSLQG